MNLHCPGGARLVVSAMLTASLAAGCGSPGTPQPPSLKIPQPVSDLSASRSGSEVHLHWTMPRRATDRVELVGDQAAVICRSERTVPCQPVGRASLPEGAPADYTDTLPDTLARGELRRLIYTVELTNHRGRSAGESNPAYTAAGEVPVGLGDVAAAATAKGVVLTWGAPPVAGQVVRMERTRLLRPGESSRPSADETRNGVPEPLIQTLEAIPARNAGTGGSCILDADAPLDARYAYRLQPLVRMSLEKQTVEVRGPASEVRFFAKDVFPPAVPQGLAAVADVGAGAIDLSWAPNNERDLAGYSVYRKRAGTADTFARISGEALVQAPAWRDAHPERGVQYAYVVSAVDRDGNESARSEPATELLAPVQAP